MECLAHFIHCGGEDVYLDGHPVDDWATASGHHDDSNHGVHDEDWNNDRGTTLIVDGRIWDSRTAPNGSLVVLANTSRESTTARKTFSGVGSSTDPTVSRMGGYEYHGTLTCRDSYKSVHTYLMIRLPCVLA